MTRRAIGWVVLLVLFVLHNDFWLWHRADLVLGLPIGLLYHIGYCLLVSGAMLLLVRRVWEGLADA